MDKAVSGWLYGWKDIANYVGCDLKTINKYVDEYKLPVHCFPNGKPFAIPSEIDKWGRNLKRK